MSDPLRTDGSRALLAAPEVDREARIEPLLLAGLDHYFAAQYDQAIHVWTRVLFLDRSHARARAYIQRARSALAAEGRARDALNALDLLRPTDPERGDADRLRADIQRQLMSLTAGLPVTAPPVDGRVP